MKPISIGVLMSVLIWLMISSCATVPVEPLAPGELRLIGINFPEFGAIKKNLRYPVNIKFETESRPEVTRICFYWSADGPYCINVMDVNYGYGIIKVDVPTPAEGSYRLKAYVFYMRDGKSQRTNEIETSVIVTP